MYPHERSLVKKMEGKPFALIGVNSDGSPEQLRMVIAKENMTWRSFFDGPGTDGPIATKWNVQGWPTLYVVDHRGVIRHRWLGSPGEQVMDRALEELVQRAEAGDKERPKDSPPPSK
jgi:hypothetical protein